ncbi:hypothetical protein J4218_01755 [Candidatus Pacearchaeota archaeon]|nr:hypothetical protein [uncultured archaeon]MBS3078823.1 hypothetical protein [Candidatus Pacearchaeota archaeon]
MSSNLKSRLGIWGNESCVQCGACCYDYNHGQLCMNQEIRDGKSYCKEHDNLKRNHLCRNWFCADLVEACNTLSPIEDMKQNAITLGTVPNPSIVLVLQ